MKRSAEAAGATVVAVAFHRLVPQGVSGVVVLEESHFSIHTWPEVGYAAVDFFTCGTCRPEDGHRVLFEGLRAHRGEVLTVARGQHHPQPGIRVLEHELVTPAARSSRSQTTFTFAGE
jgi:S-adenosylmethionine decarboxylase proenzyme